jgi:hypothetical protein
MKKFLTRVILNLFIVIALMIVTLLYAYYFSYRENRVPHIKYSSFHKGIGVNDTIGLVLGSSHTFYGIDSKLLNGNVFNFASTCQSLMEDFSILKHIENPIERVIIPISYFSNWHYLYKTPIGGEKLRTIDYQSIYDIDYPAFLNLEDIGNFISELSKSILKQNTERFDKMGNLNGQCDSIGNEIMDAKEAFGRHNMGKDFNHLNPYLDSINMFCTKNKIELYFIVMPYSNQYRSYTRAGGFDLYLERISERYNNENCRILDFRNQFELSDEPIMFRDADHLSFCGRSVFSKFLNKQIELATSKSN